MHSFSRALLRERPVCNVIFRCDHVAFNESTHGEETVARMSAAVENGVDAPEQRGVFSRAFAKRARPFEEGELDVCSCPIVSFRERVAELLARATSLVRANKLQSREVSSLMASVFIPKFGQRSGDVRRTVSKTP